MKRITGNRLAADVLDSHTHICDLINVEYPVLQLFTDGKRNWIYLWCEAGIDETNRWLVFSTSRQLMVDYLERKSPLLTLVSQAHAHFILDTNQPLSFLFLHGDAKKRIRRQVISTSLDQVTEYLPSEDSYFDESLTADVDLTKQLTPTAYSVPILGDWFGQDFTFLFKSYERLYAFFYATQPRFVRTIDQNLERLLRSPWTGGFSRVNLYSVLSSQIPGLHSLKVEKIHYASPGQVRFEAISSIGDSIAKSTQKLIEYENEITEASRAITKTLTNANLNKKNLSQVEDKNTPIDPMQRAKLEESCELIATLLGVKTEMRTLREHSPNIVVSAKAIVSFVRQLAKLANLNRQGMLDFHQT